MDIDLGLKIMLITVICVCLLVFTFYVARVLNSIRKVIDETSKIVQDTSEVSGTIADGVKGIKEGISKGNMLAAGANFIVKLGLLKPVKDWLKKKTGKGDSGDSESDVKM